MPSTSFAGGKLRVTPPASYDVTASKDRPDRGLPGEPGYETEVSRRVLLDVLQADDLAVLQRVDLAPRASRGLPDPSGSTPRAASGTAHLEVDVAPDEDAVVLLERGGMFSWHLPVNPVGRSRPRGLEPRTASFAIDLGATEPVVDPGRRDRGLIGSLVQGAVQAIVFRFVAPVVVGKVVDRMEESARTGLVHVTDVALDAWQPFETLDELHLPTDRPLRLLLFVHGTFSSTVGGFGALALNAAGQVFLANAVHSYDAVIGYDHKTLSLDPRQNAADLLERLSRHPVGAGMTIDIITHSRGGLTTRSFVEELLPQSDWKAQVDKIVFVAATNGGTHLADPERWCDLVDLYTNLGAVVARGMALLPGAAPVAVVVSGVLRGIASFVKHLVTYAAEGDDVPGLTAMMPGGQFVKTINELQPGQPGPGTSWFVVTSNFHVRLFDDSHRPPSFPRELAVRLKEGLVDQIFEGDNDLVVDTSAMSAIGLPGGGFVADTLDFGTNDEVYHVNYFAQDAFVAAISRWLELSPGAGEQSAARPGDRGLEPTRIPPRWASDGELAELAPDSADRDLPDAVPPAPTPPPPTETPALEAPAPEPTGPEPSATEREVAPAPEATPEPEDQTTRAQVGAEMPATVVVGIEFVVRVRLSRKAIVATDGASHTEQNVDVVADRPLTVQVIGKVNAEVTNRDPDVFMLPVGGGTSELTFAVAALAPGPVAVTIVVRQGRVPTATLTLQAAAVAALPQTAWGPLSPAARAVVHTGVDAPELDGLPCIDIVERTLGDGRLVYQYAVRIEPGALPRIFESLPMRDRDEKVGQALARINETVRATSQSPREQLAAMQDIGATLFRQFFRPDLQAYLWEHRDRLDDLIVYADEPWVPWELVHLRPPKGPRQKKPRFLAQGGLVRWQLGSFPPKQIRVRRGRSRSIAPVYLDPTYSNADGVLEQEWLEQHFGATAVEATPDAIRQLLRDGGYDLLHFAGHGAASVEDILGAKVLLQGRLLGDTVEPEYLAAVTVSENARSAAPGHPGPLVVFNACQTGRSGELFTTVGGFAKAFLDAGASAFVSCLWSVNEQPARVFVETLYEQLQKGAAMAAASVAARSAARRAGDPTWLAYVVYARPDAVLATA